MFIPKRIIFLKDSFDYEISQNVYHYFKSNPNIEIIISDHQTIKDFFDKSNFSNYYQTAKKTLILGKKIITVFQTCKPSAHYQLPLISGCMGECEYCYLNTQLSDKPYIKVNVNIEDIFTKAKEYLNQRPDEITIFEGAATSDILPIEPYTKILATTIAFFANLPNARFRFVSKFNDVDTLLNIKHNQHTEIRFSINTEMIIKQYEHFTASLNHRIEAAIKVLAADYRVGLVIAPVFLYNNYQADYLNLIKYLHNKLGKYENQLTFEVISHRYTLKAKTTIKKLFPSTTLDFDEQKRTFKFGQFGYGKYLYQKDALVEMKEFFKSSLTTYFKNSKILYII